MFQALDNTVKVATCSNCNIAVVLLKLLQQRHHAILKPVSKQLQAVLHPIFCSNSSVTRVYTHSRDNPMHFFKVYSWQPTAEIICTVYS